MNSRFVSLSLCVLLAAATAAGCAKAAPPVANVAGEEITQRDLALYANYILMDQGMTLADVEDAETLKGVYQDALDTAVLYKALQKKAAEKKFYPLSDEDKRAVADDVAQLLKDQLQSLVDTYTEQAAADPSIKPEDAAKRELDERTRKSGLNRDNLTNLMMIESAAQALYDDVTKDVAVSDEQLQTGYDERLKRQTEQFAADPASYEQALADEQYYGSPVVLCRPAGYRYVKHILIAFPEDVAARIADAQANGDAEAAKKLREEELPKIKARADEVLAKLAAGGDFDALMAEYGGDPGMQEDPAMTTGYELGPATPFVEEFKAAALALAHVGDMTGLVASDFGYHIIKWVGDVPSGPLPFEGVQEALRSELLQEKLGQAWDAYVEALKTEYNVQEFPDRFPTPAPAPSASPDPAVTGQY